jgi:LuxR family maltose regulon positive regulatory protein
LWPDADAENARKSLDMTLTRLRRLLGEDDAIVAHEGRLQLSATKVWTDIRLLRAALTQVRFHRDEHAKGKPTVHAATSIAALLEHYTGVYLADEEGPPWLLAGREAIVTAVRHALVTADTVLKGESDELLVPALERALVADPTSEDLAQALMRAYLRGGRYSEVLRTYRRLREMLSLLLGVAPSVESEHIRDQAYAAESKSGVKQLG